MSRDMTQYRDVHGSGGSKKQRTPVEQEVTFSSKAIAYVAIAYSEGECGGLTDLGKSIYIDQTPLIADDGTTNFPGVTWEQRYGLPDQEPVPDFTWAASLKEVNVQLFATNPYIRTVSSPQVDKISVVLRTPAMQEVKENGDQVGTELAFRIEKYDPVAQVWITEHERFSFKGRVVSNYEVEIPVTRAGPENTDKPWQVRVSRLTPDSKTNRIINESHISYIVERVAPEGDVARYNNTAYIALRIDTSLFGDRLPVASFKVDGIKVRVPSNYNPKTRTYSGVWNGSFKFEVTSNPAWQIYDLLIDNRYGLGLSPDYVNHWELYSMGQYCDELVPDGLGGQRPRFTCRTQIQDAEDAISLLNAIASSMRAAPYWGAGSVNIVQDAPKPVAKIASQVNVIDGSFNWRGTELANRYTTCYVSWNDPNDFFRPRISKYQDDPAILKYGLNETSLAKFGCANEAEAIAFAKYVVDSSLHETQMVSFSGGMEFADARPGDIIQVADPLRAKSRMSGRVRANGTTPTRLVLDAPVTLAPGISYTLIYVTGNEDNSIITVPVTTGAGTHAAINLQTGVPFEVDHPYVIAGSDIAPKPMRIISVKEDEGKYPIVAMEFDTTKFARTELGIQIEPPTTSRYTDKSIRPPSGVRFRDEIVVRDGVHFRILTMAWDPSASEHAVGYVVQWRRENLNFSPQYTTGIREYELVNPQPGVYDFLVSAVSGLGGQESTPVQATYVVDRSRPLVIPNVSGLRLKNAVDPNGQEFRVPDAEFAWNHTGATAGEFGSDPVKAQLDETFVDYEIKIYSEDMSLLRVDSTVENWYQYSYSMNLDDRKRQGFTTPVRRFTIEVRQRGANGQVSDTAARLTVSNPAPPVPLGLKADGFFRFYRVSHSPLEFDAVGILIYASQTSGFAVGPTTLVYEGVGTFHDVEAEPGKTYYVRVAAYDTFGRFDLNYSSEMEVTTLKTEVSFDTPDVPTGFDWTSSSEILADGSQRVRITATWDPAPVGSSVPWWEVGIVENGGSEIIFPVNALPPVKPNDVQPKERPSYTFDARLNTSYTIRVRARNVVTFSGWTTAKTKTSAKDDTKPPAPSNLTIKNAFKTVFLSWSNPAIDDLDYIEVWEGFETVRTGKPITGLGKAEIVARVYTDSYTRSGLATGDLRYYWIRAIDTSGNESPYYPLDTGIKGETNKIAGGADIEANSITTNLLKSSEVWADIITTGSLDAAKLKANTILSDQIKVGPNTLATLSDWAGNPAPRVNANTVLIDPGKIRIQGSSTLLNWKMGGDSSELNGGMIATNTIKANSIQIGNRGIDISGLEFRHDGPGNKVYWSEGKIGYIDSNGALAERTIVAGSIGWVQGITYIGWKMGETKLTCFGYFTPTDGKIYVDFPAASAVILAVYSGGNKLIVHYGRTLINGADIVSNSITTAHIQSLSIKSDWIEAGAITTGKLASGAVKADNIDAGAITASKIGAGAITAEKIGTGTLTVGTWIQVGNNLWIDAKDNEGFKGRIYMNDPVTKHNMLWLGSFGGDSYGLTIHNKNGQLMFSTTSGVEGTFIRDATINTAKIIDGNITNAKITDGAITNAKIGNAQITTAKIGEAQVDTLRIAGNAVTVPVWGGLVGQPRGTGTAYQTQYMLETTVRLTQPGTVFAIANWSHEYTAVRGFRSWLQITRLDPNANGAEVLEAGWVNLGEAHAGSGSYLEAVTVSGGIPNLPKALFKLRVLWQGQDSNIKVTSGSIICTGAMR